MDLRSVREILSRCRGLAYLAILSWLMELSYGLMGQSAIPPYMQQIGLTAHIGLVYAVFIGTETVFRSVIGVVGYRIGRQTVLAMAAFVSSLTAIAITFTHNLGIILLLRAIDGVSSAAIWIMMISVMSDVVPPGRRTYALSIFTVTYMSGIALGPLVGGFANDFTHSKLASFYVVSALFAATAIAAYTLPIRPHPSAEQELIREAREFDLSVLTIGIRIAPGFMIMGFIAYFAIGLLVPIIKLFALNQLGLTELQYGELLLPVVLPVGLISLLSGRIDHIFGTARVIHIGLGLTAIGLWEAAFAYTAWEFALAAIVAGVGYVLASPAWLAYLTTMTCASDRDAVIGAVGTSYGLGAIVGTIAGSQFYHLGQLRLLDIPIRAHYLPFLVSAFMATVAFVFSLFIAKGGSARSRRGVCKGDGEGDH